MRSIILTASVATLVGLMGTSSAHADVVFGWGYNNAGQLGNGSTTGSTVPTLATNLPTTIVSVAAGGTGGFALTNTGTAYAWGGNVTRQLADGGSGFDFSAHPTPVAVASLAGTPLTAVTGLNGAFMSLSSGAAVGWGANNAGQLGIGSTASPVSSPTASNLNSGVTAVSRGYSTSYAIAGGAAYAVGDNISGQLGNGTIGSGTSTTSFATVSGLTSGVTSVAGGQTFGLAVRNGGVFTWGTNSSGQLGDGTNNTSSTPVAAINIVGTATQVAAGSSSALALVNGQVYSWGFNGSGQLGNGSTTSSSTPTLVAGIVGTVAQISTGNLSSYALTTDGRLYVWGDNTAGQLGLGTTANVLTPTLLSAPAGYAWTSISGGLAANGSVGFALATAAAVPEPSSIAAVLVGVTLLGRRRRA